MGTDCPQRYSVNRDQTVIVLCRPSVTKGVSVTTDSSISTRLLLDIPLSYLLYGLLLRNVNFPPQSDV